MGERSPVLPTLSLLSGALIPFLILGASLLLAVSGVVGIVAADWPFWKRSLAISQLKDGGEWPESFYQPVARIDGGGQGAFFPAAAPGEATIDPAALEAAAAWAEANNSAALLVLHEGRVQFERYWQGMSAEQLFSGRALSRSLVGLAFGFAVAEGRLALDDPAGKHLEEWRDDARGWDRYDFKSHGGHGVDELEVFARS